MHIKPDPDAQSLTPTPRACCCVCFSVQGCPQGPHTAGFQFIAGKQRVWHASTILDLHLTHVHTALCSCRLYKNAVRLHCRTVPCVCMASYCRAGTAHHVRHHDEATVQAPASVTQSLGHSVTTASATMLRHHLRLMTSPCLPRCQIVQASSSPGQTIHQRSWFALSPHQAPPCPP